MRAITHFLRNNPRSRALLADACERADEIRRLRDEHGWPEPSTLDALRRDPRYRLRNRLDGSVEPRDLVVACALLLLVAEDVS